MSSNIMYLYLDLWIIKLRMISATSNGNDFFNTDNTVKSDRQFDNKHCCPFFLRETQICHELDLLQDQTGAACSPSCPESIVHHQSGCV